MLVLTRRVGEVLHIGDNVEVTITKIKGNQVEVGITAPREVHIIRGEIKGTDRDKPRHLGNS